MISTFLPTAARAVARLMAVVVFPTPPFWLARAITRRAWSSCSASSARLLVFSPPVPFFWSAACARPFSGLPASDMGEFLHANDPAPLVGDTGIDGHGHIPGFARPGQFLVQVLPFMKEGLSVLGEERIGEPQQTPQGRKRPRRH